jgi:hypothetical protein
MDEYNQYTTGLLAPPARAVAIVPSDSINLDFVTRGIYIGAAGNIKALTLFEDEATFVNLPAGFILVGQFIRVFDTDTTATSLVALA